MRPGLSEEDVKRIREAWKQVQEVVRRFVEAIRDVAEKLKEILPKILQAAFPQGPPRSLFRERERIKQAGIIAWFRQYERKRLNAVSQVYKPP